LTLDIFLLYFASSSLIRVFLIYVRILKFAKRLKKYYLWKAISRELREFEETREYYRQALAIKVEFGDRYSQASVYHRLGIVAGELREFEEARQNYRQALAIFVEFGDRYSQANTYFQLGRVAGQLCEFGEAKENFRQALAIFIKFNDRYPQAASTYQGLGVVAEDLGELEEAKTNFLQACQIWAEFNDEYHLQILSIPALARIYQVTKDDSLIEAIAGILSIGVDEVRRRLEST
jgi:tetratricopeptide (TPR) repeat protein